MKGDLSAGVTVKITASENSKILAGEVDIQVFFGNILDLNTLNNTIEWQTSATLITEDKAKERWFSQNRDVLETYNGEAIADWFETSNFISGDDNTSGSVDIMVDSMHNAQFQNKINVQIQTVIKQTGKIDTSVGGGTGIIEHITNDKIHSTAELSNGTILAGGAKSIYKLTSDGRIKNKTTNVDHTIYSIIELKNGNIFASVSDNSANYIYKLNEDGTINSKIENTFNAGIRSMVQLSDDTILAGDNTGSIYKLTDEGKLDTSVGDGTGIIENGTLDGGINKIVELSNGTILDITDSRTRGSIYKLTDEGKIDTVAGNNGKIEDRTLDGAVCITELSNGTILAGTDAGSIYWLRTDGTIDDSIGNGGKIEDGTLNDGGVFSITELSNGNILAASPKNTASTGSIYRLVN